MKRVINAKDSLQNIMSSNSISSNFSGGLKYHDIYYVGNQKYSVHHSSLYDPNEVLVQITEIHPYSESEYVWARIGYSDIDEVEFLKYGKVISVEYIGYYDPDKWGYDQEGCKSFWEDQIQDICEQLKKYNDGIESMISHY